MSVIGIGTDIVDIRRLESMSDKVRDRLAQRVLTAIEYEYYQAITCSIAYLAKRWAAKEAAAKALGTGIAKGISFQHIQIESLDSGQPILIFFDNAKQLAADLGANSWHISLSDEAHYAVAFVVMSA